MTITVECPNPLCSNYGHAIDVEPPVLDEEEVADRGLVVGQIDPGWGGVSCGGEIPYGNGTCGESLHQHQPGA